MVRVVVRDLVAVLACTGVHVESYLCLSSGCTSRRFAAADTRRHQESLVRHRRTERPQTGPKALPSGRLQLAHAPSRVSRSSLLLDICISCFCFIPAPGSLPRTHRPAVARRCWTTTEKGLAPTAGSITDDYIPTCVCLSRPRIIVTTLTDIRIDRWPTTTTTDPDDTIPTILQYI